MPVSTVREAKILGYLHLQIEQIGAEKAVPYMTTEQFDLFKSEADWRNYVQYLNSEQIALLEGGHLESMGSKVNEIKYINEIKIDGGTNSPFMSIDHSKLTQKQLESLDVSQIELLIEHNKLSSLGDKVPHLNPENFANAAENLANAASNGADIKEKLAIDKLSQDQIDELVSRENIKLDELDEALQEKYVEKYEAAEKATAQEAPSKSENSAAEGCKNTPETTNDGEGTKAAVETAVEAAAENVAGTVATVCAVVAMLIVFAVIFRSFGKEASSNSHSPRST